ncbi:unnamed protein product, partial [Staurois parvus]
MRTDTENYTRHPGQEKWDCAESIQNRRSGTVQSPYRTGEVGLQSPHRTGDVGLCRVHTGQEKWGLCRVHTGQEK